MFKCTFEMYKKIFENFFDWFIMKELIIKDSES